MAAFDPHAAQIKVLEQALSFAHDVERQLRERIQRLEMLHVADYDCNQSLEFRIYPDKSGARLIIDEFTRAWINFPNSKLPALRIDNPFESSRYSEGGSGEYVNNEEAMNRFEGKT